VIRRGLKTEFPKPDFVSIASATDQNRAPTRGLPRDLLYPKVSYIGTARMADRLGALR
jgi:hypothetical protein